MYNISSHLLQCINYLDMIRRQSISCIEAYDWPVTTYTYNPIRGETLPQKRMDLMAIDREI